MVLMLTRRNEFSSNKLFVVQCGTFSKFGGNAFYRLLLSVSLQLDCPNENLRLNLEN